MLKFILESFDRRYLIGYFVSGLLYVVLPRFLEVTSPEVMREHFFRNFLLTLLIGILPFLILAAYGKTLRGSFGSSSNPSLWTFCWRMIGCSLLCGLSLWPISVITMAIFSQLFLKGGSFDIKTANLILNAIASTLFLPAFIYMVGAYSSALSRETATFSFRDAFDFFKHPFLAKTFGWVFVIYAIPSLMRMILIWLDTKDMNWFYVEYFLNTTFHLLGFFLIMHYTQIRVLKLLPKQNGA